MKNNQAKGAEPEPGGEVLSPGLGPPFMGEGSQGGADTSTALSALCSASVPLLDALPHHWWEGNCLLHKQPLWLQGHF